MTADNLLTLAVRKAREADPYSQLREDPTPPSSDEDAAQLIGQIVISICSVQSVEAHVPRV